MATSYEGGGNAALKSFGQPQTHKKKKTTDPCHADNHTHDQSSEAGSEQPPELPERLLKHLSPVHEDLKGALETVWKYYVKRNNEEKIMIIFEELKKILNESVPGGHKVLSSHAGPPLVYCHVKGDALRADQQLLTSINSSKKLFRETKVWQECDFIFFFCPINSRLGADVRAAMDEVSVYGDKKIILVLMYYTHEANHSTSEKKWSEEFPKIKLQVPVFFHDTVGGLLHCDTNTKAIRQIEAFMRKRSTEVDTDAKSNQSQCQIQ